MEDELDKPVDSVYLDLQLAELQKQHLIDLQRLYDVHAGEYHDEAMDRYLSKDDSQYLVQGERDPEYIQIYAKLDVSDTPPQ